MRFKKHIVRFDDTIQLISQRYYGTTDNWMDLIEHNDLKYPYIVNTSEEKMKNPEHLVTIGDDIVIPLVKDLADVEAKEITSKDRDVLLDLALGRDLNMTANEKYFNLHGTSDELLGLDGNGKGDISTVTAVNNVKQAIQARLLTPKGALALHPDYGSNLHTMFGKITPQLGLKLENEILLTIKTDKRVVSADTITWKFVEDRFEGAFSVTLFSVEDAIKLVLSADSDGVFALFE